MILALNRWIYFILFNAMLPVFCDSDIFSSKAAIELILPNEDGLWTSKYIRGVYTNAGAIIKVEGNLEQVHPTTLCSSRPQLTFGTIYLLKLDRHDSYPHHGGFCTSAADQASIAIYHGATAIILITTEREEETANELLKVAQPLERPVLVVHESSEEDKLLAILNGRESVYMRISPVDLPQAQAETPSLLYKSHQENITYIGIAVIFSLILVFVAIASGVILKLRNIRRRIQIQTRERILENIRTYKYKPRRLGQDLTSNLKTDSPGPCPICLEQYNVGEEMRILPCTHEYHRKCIDKWLTEHSTCPCCCGDIDELLRLERAGRHRDKSSDRHSCCKSSDTFCSHQCSHGTSEHILTGCRSQCSSLTYAYGNMHELILPRDHQLFAQRQYQYLLHRLYEIKKQRPSSATISDTTEGISNRLSLMSSCYGSTIDIDSSLPCENNFIGDSCQGGVPRQCDAFSVCDVDLGDKCSIIKQYAGSKSTFPSIDSVSVSPRVSEFDSSSSKGRPCNRCHCRRKHKIRTVTFREPESEVLSSAEEDMYVCECEPCHACLLKNSKDTSVRWSEEDSSSSQNATEPRWNIEVEEVHV